MVSGRFRSFLGRFRLFYIVLTRFSSFLTFVSTLSVRIEKTNEIK